MKRFLTTLCCVLFMVGSTIAQTRQLTGKVTGPDDKGVASATVKVKGASTVTTTDADGLFSLSVPTGDVTLEISSVGFGLTEVRVGASQTAVAVTLSSQTGEMAEVVVTALGIKREKKMLGYATQQVSGDEIRRTASPNIMEAISGKAAGLDIKVSNSGAGGSTKAVLRGAKSLIGTSEALYVIDGVPMVNNKGGQPGSYGGVDGGDGISALNPADIESINVLRGANASILYGSQGANGVILITTKKGKAGRTVVDFNSSLVLEQVADLPEFQYKYGTVSGGDYSWSKTPGTYQNNYIEDFFQTGSILTNSVSVSGGNDKTTAYFSYSNMTAKGVVPKNTYGKNTITLNQSTKFLNDKLTLSSNVIFSSEKSVNRPVAGYYNNPLTGLFLFARERDFASYKSNYQIYNPDRNMYRQNWYSTEEKQNNPYWELNNNSKLHTNNRVIANIKASFEIAKNLRFDARGNIDYNNVVRDNRWAAGGNSVSVGPNGTWNYSEYKDKSLYADGIFTYTNNFGDFSLSALLGASYQKNTYGDGMSVGNGTQSLLYPNYFTFSNFPTNIIFNKGINKILKQGVFASTQLGFKEMIFLELSARNDWASTLALTGNESYLYPAVGLSAIVSEMIRMPEFISFWKIRGSWSQTGNEVPFNVVNPQNSIGNAVGGINRNTQVPFTNLKPEIIQGSEIGTEIKFFKGRLGFDFTYYKDISTNQFLSLAAPSGSGFTSYFVNAGKIVNQGIEFTIDAEPLRSKTVRWRTSINGSRNTNVIEELIASNPNYQVGGDDEGFASIIKAGGSFNDLYIFKFNRNAQGQIILSAAGVPTRAAASVKVGNVNPDFLLGWNNNISVGQFFINVLVNGKFGGVAFSKTEAFLDSYGVSERSAADRDKGSMVIDAVQGTTAVKSIDPVVYYSAIGDRNKIMEPYVFSRTNVRLGQLSIGYSLKLKEGGPIKDANFSLIGRNLFFFYKDAPFDPEQSMSTANNSQSNDVFSLPPVRSYGFNVKFTF